MSKVRDRHKACMPFFCSCHGQASSENDIALFLIIMNFETFKSDEARRQR
jgi:hypothetical protein